MEEGKYNQNNYYQFFISFSQKSLFFSFTKSLLSLRQLFDDGVCKGALICCLELSLFQILPFNKLGNSLNSSVFSFSKICESFILLGLIDVLLLFLPLNLAVLILVICLLLSCDLLVALVFSLETGLGIGIDGLPHIADDLGDLCDLGSGVLSFDAVIDFLPVEEKGGECPLGGGWLS